MGFVTWNMGLYNRSAIGQNSTSYDGSITDEFIKHATNIKWSIPLNAPDQLTFDLYLDDPAAALISRKQSIIRIWRYVNDPDAEKILTPSSGTPDFCGIVTSTVKQASADTLSVTCMSPLWRLQTHFHIDNHRLQTDAASLIGGDFEGGNGDDLPWDQSALMFRLIDMINGAFKDSGGDTGIRKPLVGPPFWEKTIEVAPYFVQKGSFTWAHIFDDLMARASAPDIVEEYIYSSGSEDLMYFKTTPVRGTDISGSFTFDYRTGRKNISDITETATVVPGTYGNLIWVIGDGGTNGGSYKDAIDTDDITANGLYMAQKQVQGAKLKDVTSMAPTELQIAVKSDAEVYTCEVATGISDYYGIDYNIGDLTALNADKGALQADNVKQRIYQVDLGYSDNNVETVGVSISEDFKSKFPPE